LHQTVAYITVLAQAISGSRPASSEIQIQANKLYLNNAMPCLPQIFLADALTTLKNVIFFPFFV